MTFSSKAKTHPLCFHPAHRLHLAPFQGSTLEPSGRLLHHGERQFVGGRLDLVLGLQVRHPLGADPINGRDDVTLGQAAAHCLAARSYL